MECKNDPTGGVPYWDPTYDHLIQPFPECVFLREYFNDFKFQVRKVSIKEIFSIIMKANCFAMYLINELLQFNFINIEKGNLHDHVKFFLSINLHSLFD